MVSADDNTTLTWKKFIRKQGVLFDIALIVIAFMHIRFRNLKKNLLGEWRSGVSFGLPPILSQIRFPNWCHLCDEFAHFLSTPREFYLVLSMPRIVLNQMQADYNKRREVSRPPEMQHVELMKCQPDSPPHRGKNCNHKPHLKNDTNTSANRKAHPEMDGNVRLSRLSVHLMI